MPRSCLTCPPTSFQPTFAFVIAADHLTELSGLEGQRRIAGLRVERDGHVVVRDEPAAPDLSEARRPPKPELSLVPVLQRRAYPVEAVPECNVVADGDDEVSNLVVKWALERRERACPRFPFCVRSDVPERRRDVERHDVRRVKRHQTLEVHFAKCRYRRLYPVSDVGLVDRTLRCHRYLRVGP